MLQHRLIALCVLPQKRSANLLDKMVARKAELQKMVQSPDNTYAEKLANWEKEGEERRELIAMREDCA